MAGTWLLGRDAAGGSAAAPPRAVLLAVRDSDGGNAADDQGLGTEGSLQELARLADTDGLTVVDEVVQTRKRPDPATYVGSGKVDELGATVQRSGADLVIADGELSPAQIRNLEERVSTRVVDRTALILDIFAEHARTSEGRIQVELAQIAYQLPRLRGRGEAMSRVGGGRMAGGAGMGVRGPGEMRLESQRRRLRQRAARLRQRTAELARRGERKRRARARNRVPSVAITGYTNAGKSSLLNRMTGADALVRGALFATLDPTVRRVSAPELTYTLTDTVGFVRHLPHELVDAFRSTLEEVNHGDLVLHVVDASASDVIGQVTTVHAVLREIGAGNLPELLVLNKIDIVPPERMAALHTLYPHAVPVSVLTGEGVQDLYAAILDRLEAKQVHPA